jgi:hypothetical protein
MAIFSSIAVTELQREMPTSLHGVTSRQHETPISLIARSSWKTLAKSKDATRKKCHLLHLAMVAHVSH